MKRHFYNNREYTIDKEKKVIILNPDFHLKLQNKSLWGKFGFKKIGGSSIGDILLSDNFKSQFGAFARMAWLGMPILDPKYINAGVAIEPLVVNALEEKLHLKIETFDPKQYNYDYFAEQDEILGGIPDGYIESQKCIIEIKTTGEKNFENWNKFGVPLAYLKQGQLYSYLMGVDKFHIVATFLKEEDYLEPEKYPIKNRKLKVYSYKVNQAQVIDDIIKVKNWYQKYTASGISPQYDEQKDGELLEWLECSNEIEFQQLLDKWELQGKYVKVADE